MKRDIKILSGLSPSDSISEFAERGVAEVYAGFYDKESEKRWPVAFNVINRRGEGASFFGMKSFSKMIKEAEKFDIFVYVVFNVSYSKKQLSWIISQIKKLSKFKQVKGVIVNDINLLLLLKKIKYNKEIVISTLGSNFNKYAIEFYKTFGASRVVLDRQLTALEVLEIVKIFPDIRFEIFLLMAEGCFFIDGYCSSLHTQELNSKRKNKTERYNITVNETLCMDVLNSQARRNKNYDEKRIQNIIHQKSIYKCNICLLYDLRFYNNITLKIPNRTITNSKGTALIDIIDKIKNKLGEKNISRKKFYSFCKKILMEEKGLKCSSKVCLCRDLYDKSDMLK